ncbi:hypothetical protein ACI3LY_003841 [Candidozyma auris]|uniref:Uncharacterized protein n=1 Tax=Candidozyma auris TaxID=498019 RepID=A0A2H1A243_CANAR|nr:hypothetical protein QG37_04265 [[Candida] auris]PIS56150.1 hypothetical protein CJI97_001396 [[Candida] auris]PIS56672.1 hypothetical protein B9J08_001210 [[Candida] auris]PSK76736.1 hypothetical protein CJJ07_003430 [[Candida] auris]QEL61326.1 hypothetical protein CJJ09_003465 [[Candida] auris]
MGDGVAVNVLGTIGTILWCIQLVPQIIRNFSKKNCTGLPPLMMFLWAASGVPFSIYFFGIDGSIPLRVQPQLFTFCCTVSWAQTLYYPPVAYPKRKVALMLGSFVLVSVGLETGFILWLRPLYRRGIEWPMLVIGIIASVLLALGLVPPYFELAKRKGRVVGINFFFLAMDSFGALFSLISVVVGEMDIMSMVLYAIVIAMEIGIFLSQVGWYLTGGRRILREEKLQRKQCIQKEVSVGSETSERSQASDYNEDDEKPQEGTAGDLEALGKNL